MASEEQQHNQKPQNPSTLIRASEPIHVTLGESGAPIELSWGGMMYRVVSRPILWVKRERWWEHRQSLQEIPVWRFSAVAVEGEGGGAQVAGPLVRVEVMRLSTPQRWQLVACERVEPDKPDKPAERAKGQAKPARQTKSTESAKPVPAKSIKPAKSAEPTGT